MTLRTADQYAGMNRKCSSCQLVITIPESAEDPSFIVVDESVIDNGAVEEQPRPSPKPSRPHREPLPRFEDELPPRNDVPIISSSPIGIKAIVNFDHPIVPVLAPFSFWSGTAIALIAVFVGSLFGLKFILEDQPTVGLLLCHRAVKTDHLWAVQNRPF